MKNDKHDKHEHDKQITRAICSITAAAGKKTNAKFVFFCFYRA